MTIFFTHHSRERMNLRKIAQSDIERTISSPDRSFPGKKRDTIKFIKHIDGRRHEVIGKFLKDQNAWLVLSVWVRGEEDRKPLLDQMVLLPFKVVFWIVKTIFRTLFPKKK